MPYVTVNELLRNAFEHHRAGRLDEAEQAYRQVLALEPRSAVELEPTYRAAWDNLLYALHYHPAYDAAAIFAEHRRWAELHADPLTRGYVAVHHNDRSPDRRLRIGYVSPNFREHPVGRAMLPLLEHHDREQFDVICYADTTADDPIARRLRATTSEWHVTRALDDAKLAALVREHRIDILVDTSLHLANNRL